MKKVATRGSPVFFAAIALFFISTSAHADDDAAAAAAMQRGIAAYGQGDVQGALTAYLEAERLAPRANVPFLYAAEALVRLERYVEAVDSLKQYLEKNPEVSDAAEVRTRIATLISHHFPGRVKISANVASARVTIDGTSRAETLPATVTLPAGPHAIRLSAEGYEPLTSNVVVTGEAEVTDDLNLTPLPPKLPPPLPPDPPSSGVGSLRTVGWVTLAVGAATLGTAIILDWTALKQKTDDFTTAKNADSPSAIGLQSDVRSLRAGVLATYVAGGVIAAGGVALVLLAPRSPLKTTGSVTLRLESKVMPGRSEIGLSGTF